jgi:NDP-sugar pyrophosphorylase family protein
MNFAIISAGEGSRLKEEGVLKPKALAEVGGHPLISYIINIVLKYTDTLYIIVNDKSVEILSYIISEYPNIKLKPIIKTTASSLHSLYELTQVMGNEPFILFTVDSIFNEKDFDNFLNEARSQNDGATIAVTTYIDDEKPLYVRATNNEITSFDDEFSGQTLVTGGIYHLSPQAAALAKDCVKSGMNKLRNFQRALLKNNIKVRSFNFEKIVDVDHVKDIKEAEAFLAEMNDNR